MVATVKEVAKWLIVGGDGQLGRAMQAELLKSDTEFLALNHSQLDITDENAVTNSILQHHPNVVLNAAGWTNVDGAEDSEEIARLINAISPGYLAEACSQIKSKFLHISTDYVFSGNAKIPWTEGSPLSPISAYGRTKAEGEGVVRNVYPTGSYIVRTSWLYSPWGKNFVKTMIHLALEEIGPVKVVSDQYGQPTSALDLASRLNHMVGRGIAPGVYHGTNSGKASWFEFAQYIFKKCGADPERVLSVDSNHEPRSAKRPFYSVLGHQRWIDVGLEPMQDWHDAIDEMFPLLINAGNLGE